MHYTPTPPPKGYHLVPCDGAAHESAHNDHCGRCAPRWARLMVPVEFSTAEAFRAHLDGLEREHAKSLRTTVQRASTRHARAEARRYLAWQVGNEATRSLENCGRALTHAAHEGERSLADAVMWLLFALQ